MRRMFTKKEIFQPEEFIESTDALANPGCGWYHLYTFDAADADTPLYVACPAEELVLLRISIAACRERELSGTELKNIARILRFFQDKQKDMILRFVYDIDGKGMEVEPVAVSLVQRHMRQLGAVIREFVSAVLVVQGILVGNWGEMHGSKFLSEKYLKMLTQTMLEAIGPDIFLAVRTLKQFQTVTAEMKETQIRQIVFFNDGIFGSATDLGTYGVARDEQQGEQLREDALLWQKQNARCRFNGGEVLNGAETEKDRMRWQKVELASADLADMHISYLNSIYHPQVLQAWKEANICWPGTGQILSGYEFIGRHLGYRFVLRSLSVDRKRKMHIFIENCGFAECCQDVRCELIWQQGERESRLQVDTDVKAWESGKLTEITIPCQRPETFSDTADSFCYLSLRRLLDGRVIRFANEGAGERFLIGMIKAV